MAPGLSSWGNLEEERGNLRVSTWVLNILTNLCLGRLHQRSRFEADLAPAYAGNERNNQSGPDGNQTLV